jgi:hypothetical protein
VKGEGGRWEEEGNHLLESARGGEKDTRMYHRYSVSSQKSNIWLDTSQFFRFLLVCW